MRERAQKMLMSGQSESTSAINKRIIRTGGVRVLGRAAPKPQIHIVQNASVTQQPKALDTSSSDTDTNSAQVNDKPNQNITEKTNQEVDEKSNQDVDHLQKENTEDLKKDTTKNETAKETNKEGDKETNKEDSKVQRTAQGKKEPRKKRLHMLHSEVKPVSKQPSASALSMASQPPVEKPVPVPRTTPTPKVETVSREEEEEECTDNINTTAEADVHDEVCTTPPNGRAQSPDATQVS